MPNFSGFGNDSEGVNPSNYFEHPLKMQTLQSMPGPSIGHDLLDMSSSIYKEEEHENVRGDNIYNDIERIDNEEEYVRMPDPWQ